MFLLGFSALLEPCPSIGQAATHPPERTCLAGLPCLVDYIGLQVTELEQFGLPGWHGARQVFPEMLAPVFALEQAWRLLLKKANRFPDVALAWMPSIDLGVVFRSAL